MNKQSLGNQKKVEETLNFWSKTKTIHDELNKLHDNIHQAPLNALAVFLIKSQWVEYSLKTLLSTIDFRLSKDNAFAEMSRDEQVKRMMLGQLCDEMDKYSFKDEETEKTYKALVRRVKFFNKNYRNEYAHRLFSSKKNFQVVKQELLAGIKVAQAIEDLETKMMVHMYPDLFDSSKLKKTTDQTGVK